MVMAAVGKHDVVTCNCMCTTVEWQWVQVDMLRNVNVVTPNLPQIHNNFTFASFVTCILYASRGISAVIVIQSNIMLRYNNHYVKTHNCSALVRT